MDVVPYGGDASRRPDPPAPTTRTAEFDAVQTAADDVALLALTSGTTGRPKVTMHFHRDVLANADTFSRHVLRPQPDDVFATTAPFAFTFGLGAGWCSRCTRVPRRCSIEKGDAGRAGRRRGPTRRHDPVHRPDGVQGDARGRRSGDLLRGLRRAVSAGEHLPAATWQAFRDATGVRIIDGIGSTEMLHIFIASADDDIRPGSTGRAVPGYVATVLDEHDREAPAGQRDGWRSRADRLPIPRRRAADGSTSRTAGTSPATRTCAMRTGTSGTRPAATT